MYQALLTNRYLTSRVIPLIAVASVALCTALVIIVVSVMTGFVDLIRESGKTLMGDVVVVGPVEGLPHYEELAAAFEALPEADAATPVTETLGLVNLPYDAPRFVKIWGIESETFGRVTGFNDAIYWDEETTHDRFAPELLKASLAEQWPRLVDELSAEQRAKIQRAASPWFDPLFEDQPLSFKQRREVVGFLGDAGLEMLLSVLTDEQKSKLIARDGRLAADGNFLTGLNAAQIAKDGRAARRLTTGEPGIVLGIHVSELNQRQADNTYEPQGRWWMPTWHVTLTVPVFSSEGRPLKPKDRILPVVNEYQSGVFQIDAQQVMIPLEVGQEMMGLDASDLVDPNRLDPDTGFPLIIGRNPARVSMILVRAVEGVTPDELKMRITAAYEQVQVDLIARGDPDLLEQLGFRAWIRTWAEQQAGFIGPVEKERDLMRILFSIVYVVAAGLVLVIFWAIVYEKTRDIGILRSIGASRGGILWIFVRYGLFVGILGALTGLGLAYLVVHNINHIHDMLGSPFPRAAWITMFVLAAGAMVLTIWRITRGAILPVVLSSMLTIVLAAMAIGMMLHQGFLVWDPKVYYFTEIPNHLDRDAAIGTLIGAVVFSVLGALIPASRAGDINPVAALRYE